MMEWTKIPVDLLQTRKTDKEILAIVKYQLLWAMLERRPDDDVALRYMTSKQLQQARDYVSSIEHCVDIDIKSAIKNRKRQKIFYTKKQSLIEKPNCQTNNKTNDKTTVATINVASASAVKAGQKLAEVSLPFDVKTFVTASAAAGSNAGSGATASTNLIVTLGYIPR